MTEPAAPHAASFDIAENSAAGAGGRLFQPVGAWILAQASDLDIQLARLDPATTPGLRIDGGRLTQLDTAGAWLLVRLARRLEVQHGKVEFVNFDPSHATLLERVAEVEPEVEPLNAARPNGLTTFLARIGAATIGVGTQARDLVGFLGLAMITLGRSLKQPHRFRLTALVSQIEKTGLDAMPIVGLLTFLIGVVLAYQGAETLRGFGAEIYTVNLLGVSILRELGILITAIIVAGRSGSAFTAQIGTMKVNQEVDAMQTMGLDPVEVLVLPRMLALIVTLPLLTFFANIMGLLGGGVICMVLLDISPDQYMRQLANTTDISHFWVGMIKAPFFAVIIALVGCFEGLRVSGSAESVGRLTTQSVVEAIFLVIIADAAFSILFQLMGI
ncbi:MAG: MlaE family lipid ABC transporter permease subunit [Alphaproteobacteria bacterium]|nr:MlaE family lipid ABC transporter permease subunit [Alphaproteobacteria bacterium]MBU0796875.1 MlaE family lipid ABC transporter permease subunit [Alphaproteobacteria bacterium]MBU0886929.1 MlaE family lipid ABC transporter permease subunit [Alphaproteobacteria bacterium]MBU1813215.1 MlaE family lipid ABC transporter permease subunit [Alphaproteobacteria bacterium]